MSDFTANLKFRRISSADVSQEKSLTKTPSHLKNAALSEKINWTNCLIVFGIPSLAIYGLCTTKIEFNTIIFAVVYYFITGMGITAGYHRLWSHASYKASSLIELCLMMGASGALQGSAKHWSFLHRAHHRWTDTDRDPYNSVRGFWYAHFGWLLFHDSRIEGGHIPMMDLKSNKIIRWQHSNYAWFGPFMSLIFPALIAWLFWNDFRGGFYIVGALRCAVLHQGTWCVNSVAHSDVFGGKHTYDDTITPHDSIITAILTFGEGYHNFHHEFPNDYRNGIKWYHYDPTKWFLNISNWMGLVSELNEFSDNEIMRGVLDMKEKNLLKEKECINYGVDIKTLPIWTMDEYKKDLKMNKLNKNGKVYVIFNDIVHEIQQELIETHPGGINMIKSREGKDITKAFNGNVYNHSNAARNILSHYRIARLHVNN